MHIGVCISSIEGIYGFAYMNTCMILYVCMCIYTHTVATRAHTILPSPHRVEGQLEALHSRQAKRVEEEPKELGRALEGEPLRLGEQ